MAGNHHAAIAELSKLLTSETGVPPLSERIRTQLQSAYDDLTVRDEVLRARETLNRVRHANLLEVNVHVVGHVERVLTMM